MAQPENPRLSKDEHLSVIRETVNQVSGKIPVIAGTGANSTEEALHLKKCTEHGVDGFAVAPYYNKPSQEGLLLIFQRLQKFWTSPSFFIQFPADAGSISTDTILRLQEKYPHVCALKEGRKSTKFLTLLRNRR